jgi:hypothetical protein
VLVDWNFGEENATTPHQLPTRFASETKTGFRYSDDTSKN